MAGHFCDSPSLARTSVLILSPCHNPLLFFALGNPATVLRWRVFFVSAPSPEVSLCLLSTLQSSVTETCSITLFSPTLCFPAFTVLKSTYATVPVVSNKASSVCVGKLKNTGCPALAHASRHHQHSSLSPPPPMIAVTLGVDHSSPTRTRGAGSPAWRQPELFFVHYQPVGD